MIIYGSGGSKGGAPGARPPTDQNFLNLMQFWGKSSKFVCWRPVGVGAPSYEESCIRPCMVTLQFTWDHTQKKWVLPIGREPIPCALISG